MNVISRGRGQSAVAAAAYRAGARLRDHHYGVVRDYTKRRPAVHAEVMTPPAAPDWAAGREALWNRVELAERRKDAQLARAIDLSLPGELSDGQCLELLRDYCSRAFVSHGMIADLSLRREAPGRPHAHLLLTLREMRRDGFGPKQRQWNGKARLIEWRRTWALCANDHLARAGHATRIDHRTLEAQQIELTPARRVGGGRIGERTVTLPRHLADRVAEQCRIVHDNGRLILEDPAAALRALAEQSATFRSDDVARFLKSRTTAEQYAAAYGAVMSSDELVSVGAAAEDAVSGRRFTTRDMIETAQSLGRRTRTLKARRGHALGPANHAPAGLAPAGPRECLSDQQRRLFDYLVADGAVKALVLAADPGTVTLLAAARAAWEARGFHTLGNGEAALDFKSILLVEDADMMGLKQLERTVASVERARAKVVLLGDTGRARAMRLDSPFRAILREVGVETTA